MNPRENLAGLGISRHDGPIAALQLFSRPLESIEPESRLACRTIRAVTGDASVREDWANFTVEIHSAVEQRREEQQTGEKSAGYHCGGGSDAMNLT